MAKHVKALVKPELIRSARTSMRMDAPQAARKVNIAEEKLAAWEQGIDQPTIRQLRELGNVYKRPLAYFYLPEPPRDFQSMRIKDFRQLPDAQLGRFSPELCLAIRMADYRRKVALDLYENLDDRPPTFNLSADLTENPEQVGLRLRTALKLTKIQQFSWSFESRDAFSQVRRAVEQLGVLVFQVPVELSEMRGLAIYADLLPVVLLSSKERFMTPRLFTLLHEVVHLMLRVSAVSSETESQLDREARRVEVFSNHVAAATLVPLPLLFEEPEVAKIAGKGVWTDQQIERIGRTFRVGKETVLRRLLAAGKVSLAEYQSARQRWLEEFAARPKKKGGAPPHHITELSRLGEAFPRLVLRNYYNDKIGATDVAEFLNMRLKHLPKIEAELRTNRTARFKNEHL
jgi:Zn-dependent peptidase ImmA (M78 family)/transcriptional regulator with XRE-family HTH domain